MPLRPNSIDEETIAKDCADDIQRRRQWQAYRHLCHVAQALDKGLESKAMESTIASAKHLTTNINDTIQRHTQVG